MVKKKEAQQTPQTPPRTSFRKNFSSGVRKAAVDTVASKSTTETATEAESIQVDKNYQHPDFRNLTEPDRTLARIDYIIQNPDFSHGERATAIAIIRAFYEKTGRVTMVVRDVAPDQHGFSGGVRSATMKKLEECELLTKKTIKKRGTEIELLF